MRNYLKIVICHVSLFLMLCTVLGLSACSSPQLPPPTIPGNIDTTGTLPVDTPSNNEQVTLHLIIIADTDDISIGQSTQIDLRNMQRLMGAIAAQSLDRIVLKPLIRDKRITHQELLNILERLHVQPHDIIVFHWAGHGHGSPGAKWPYLDTAAKTTDFRQVIEMLNSKNARQMIALADCCNAPLINTRDIYAAQSLRRQLFFPENIVKMFIQPKIKIIASGSQSGQYASGTNSLGGYFTYNFLTTLEEALLNENNPDSVWEKVMRTTRDRVRYDTRNKQTPQYKINPINDKELNKIDAGDIDTPVDEHAESVNKDITKKEPVSPGDFNQLMDKILQEIK